MNKFWANRIRYYTSLRVASPKAYGIASLRAQPKKRRVVHLRGLIQNRGFVRVAAPVPRLLNKLDLFIQPLRG
jgi:hypothetical protein